MEAADWAALPRDLLLDVFFRLGPREVMLGAEFACTAWRRAALEEPTLWRRVGKDYDPFDERCRRACNGAETAMRFAAAGRAAGQCEAFEGNCGDRDLFCLVKKAPSLKSLHVEHYLDYDDESGRLLVKALKKLTKLEDLQIYFQYAIDGNDNLLGSICRACPRLKTLVLIYASSIDLGYHSPEPIDGEIPMMHELRCLRLYECDLTRKGLKSILDSCPVLETLEIEGYFNKGRNKELRAKCARLKEVTLPSRIKDYNH